jgi:Ca-activated chloride channel family protein
MISFGKSTYLFMFWLIPLIIVFSIWSFRKRKQLIDLFVNSPLQDRLVKGITPYSHKIKFIFLMAAMFFTLCALIGPQWGFHWEDVKRRGSDIIIAVDVSKSMLAEDISPNRLERARREIIDLLNILKGDRVGLVVFAGTSFTYCPLTIDYSAVRLFLDGLGPDLISRPGTALGDAIETSIRSFTEIDAKSQAIILITDGEDLTGHPLRAAQKAKDKGIRIYTLGIGKVEGAPIPDPEGGGFKKNPQGEIVLTHLDETTLQEIALTTGGAYVRSVTGDIDLENIYKVLQEDVHTKELTGGTIKRYKERYQWFLAIAFIFIVLEALLFKHSLRGIKKIITRPFHKGTIRFTIFFLLSIFFIDIHYGETFIERAGKGKKLYEEKKYNEALDYYLDKQIDDPDNPALAYNSASAYYKLKEYEKAEKLFMSLAQTEDKELAEKSFYNLGNTKYRLGKLEEAVESYRKALDLNSNDKDAQYNLDFVLKELEKQKQQQKQQSSSQDKKNEKHDTSRKKRPQDKDSEKKEDNQQDISPETNSQEGENNQDKTDKGSDNQQPQDNAITPEEKNKSEKDRMDQGGEPGNDQIPSDSHYDEMQAQEKAAEKGMTNEEASQWLSTLKEERPSFGGKKKQRGTVRYPEKDW